MLRNRPKMRAREKCRVQETVGATVWPTLTKQRGYFSVLYLVSWTPMPVLPPVPTIFAARTHDRLTGPRGDV